jgi:hypothetical protein
MRRGMIVSILIGLTLILSTFISTVSIVQKIAYAQARMEPSNNGVPAPNPMIQRSTVVGSNIEPGRIDTSPDIHSIASNVHASINNIQKTISAATIVTSIALLATGIYKIRQHVLAPHMHPVSH